MVELFAERGARAVRAVRLRMRRLVALAFAVALPPTTLWAAAVPDDAVARGIDALCASTPDELVRPTETFVAIFDGRPGDGVWRRADAIALRRIARDPNIYSETADVRAQRGGVVVVEIVENSLDFGARTFYCFRRSGTLARAMQTSAGTMNADRETRYLDEGGRVIARSSRITLLVPRAGASPSPDVKPAKIELYPVMSALPFADLLAGPP